MIGQKRSNHYGLFGFIVLLGLIVTAAPGPDRLVAIKKLTIIGPEGRPAIVLDGSAGWPVIRLNDSEGRPRMILYAGHQAIGPSIDLIQPDGTTKTVAIRGEDPIRSTSTSGRRTPTRPND